MNIIFSAQLVLEVLAGSHSLQPFTIWGMILGAVEIIVSVSMISVKIDNVLSWQQHCQELA